MRGFLMGIFFGVLAGVLYAPATGNRTRALLRDKYSKYSHDTTDFVDKHGRDLRNRLQGVRHDLNLLKDDILGRYDEMSMRVREQAGPLKERMVGMRDDVKTKIADARVRVESKVDEVKEQVRQRREGEERQSA